MIVWGGGEPTTGKDFNYMIGQFREKLPAAQQRILANSVKLSEIVSQLLAEDKAQIVASVDAGSVSSFAVICGRMRLQDALAPRMHYTGLNHDKVTIKYIFTVGNDSLGDVRGFVMHMSASSMLGCNFQSSSDFKNEHVSADTANAMIVIFGLLINAGAKVVYFDELLRHRLCEIVNPEDSCQIERNNADVGMEFIAIPSRYPEVIVWGAGQEAKYLVNHSAFFKTARVSHFVDATPSRIGSQYPGLDVHVPASFRDSALPVMIAAVQGYRLVLQQYRQLGLPEERVINELVL
jgi:hypothetical protein